ncbi:unnamed protein product [Cylicocyclus nassatus]|uniref:SCP domain-containing protein n=1 Tax=Cylicocyclus nassatus TaxID=53992 RepID=A0AA36DNK2_CYLNA|nr:unnamed protein product [Cylicocyclus nassatus]
MTTYLCFLALFGLVSPEPRKNVDCFKELGQNQLEEKHRNALIRALKNENYWMKYDCKFELYARNALNNTEPSNASTSEYESEDVRSVDRFLRDGVKQLGLGLFDKAGCYYAVVKNKHKLICAYQ